MVYNGIVIYVYAREEKEVTIKIAIKHPQKFARCNNSECKTVYVLNPREVLSEVGLLCPTCRDMLHTHHFVQCSCCEAIVNLIPAEPGEEPIVFTVEKCSHCHGTVEDEAEITQSYFPGVYI